MAREVSSTSAAMSGDSHDEVSSAFGDLPRAS